MDTHACIQMLTRETRMAMARRALENLLAGLRGQRPRDLVNPQVLAAGETLPLA